MKKAKDETTKQKILDVAIKLFAQKGFDGTSIRDICKTADVNLCLISYYWGGKQELYNGIIDDLIEKQTAYAKTFLDFDMDISKLNKSEQVDLLYLILDKIVDFLYTDNVSNDLVTLLIKEQQSANFPAKSPMMNFLRCLIASVFNKDINSKETIFKTLFIISQVNCARILPSFSLNLLNQTDFTEDDRNLIKKNAKTYVQTLLKEAQID